MRSHNYLYIFFLFCLIGISVDIAYAQKTTLNNHTGSWTDDASWVGGVAPGTLNLPTPIDEDYDIQGYIDVGTYPPVTTNLLTFRNISESNTLTITDTLVVYGSVDFKNFAMKVEILSGGLFIIFGDLLMDNRLDMASDGNLIIKGTFNKSGSPDEYSGSGQIYAGSYSGQAVGFAPAGQSHFAAEELKADLPAVHDFIYGNGFTPLPVELLYFNAKPAQKQVDLSWSTASELNNDFFTLEKSNNGQDFVKLGENPGNGTTNLQMDYAYTDHSPYLGLSYYRLSQTDYDGTTEVFPVVSALFEGNRIFSIYPNPLIGSSMNLKISEMGNHEFLELTIFDLQGKRVEKKQLKTDSFGNVEAEIQLQKALRKGTYIVELVSPNSKEYLKVAAH